MELYWVGSIVQKDEENSSIAAKTKLACAQPMWQYSHTDRLVFTVKNEKQKKGTEKK